MGPPRGPQLCWAAETLEPHWPGCHSHAAHGVPRLVPASPRSPAGWEGTGEKESLGGLPAF